jgi:hypothetical protein
MWHKTFTICCGAKTGRCAVLVSCLCYAGRECSSLADERATLIVDVGLSNHGQPHSRRWPSLGVRMANRCCCGRERACSKI